MTETVRAFYEQTPFPNYDDHDSVRALIEKSRTGLDARWLDEHPLQFCRKHGLARVRFMQMNLLRPALQPARFDVVLCNGVLHTPSDPYGEFRALVPLLKPGGYLVLGLYNRYGRLATDLRRYLLRAMPGKVRWIDSILRRSKLSAGKRRAWFADQYRHPHETKHTFGEILRWFDATGIEFVRGIPALRPEDKGLEGESLFEPQPRGMALDRLILQAGEIIAPGQAEGGFFIMIVRKPG